MPCTQCVRQHWGHDPPEIIFLVSRVTGRASSEAQRFSTREGRRSGPVPEYSSKLLKIFFTVRTLNRKNPGICSPQGGSTGLKQFVCIGGKVDLLWKTRASSVALSSAEIAHESSGFCSGGMFSWPVAFVKRDPLSFHQPLDDGDIFLRSFRTLVT